MEKTLEKIRKILENKGWFIKVEPMVFMGQTFVRVIMSETNVDVKNSVPYCIDSFYVVVHVPKGV